MLVHHGFRDEKARDRLAFSGVVRGRRGAAAIGPQTARETKATRSGGVAGDATLVVAGEPEAGVAGSTLRRRPDVDARFAQTLHGGKSDHGPSPFTAGS